jgi:hypothetical protein
VQYDCNEVATVKYMIMEDWTFHLPVDAVRQMPEGDYKRLTVCSLRTIRYIVLFS